VTVSRDDVEDLYAGSYARLVGVVALVAGSREEAEEVVQEAFVRLLPHWPRVSRYEDPEAWVRGVALRLLSNRFRKVRNGRAALLRHGPSADVAGPSPNGVDVVRALSALPVAHRQVVVLHYLLGHQVAAVAAELQVPVGTVKSRLSRAREVLAPLLAEESHA
jgi:RNA polymerase sigma-70 factor (ECF subfamily)